MDPLHTKRKLAGILTSIIILGSLIGIIGVGQWRNYSKTHPPSPAEPSTSQILQRISPKAANELIQQHEHDSNFSILDVRTLGEFQSGYIENAINLDFYSNTFQDELKKLPKDMIYLIYCRSGNRSNKTLSMMKKLQFIHAYDMTGGITGWLAQEFPVVK